MSQLTENLLPDPRTDDDGERRFLLRNVSWGMYVLLREAMDDTAIKMTYCDGALELMSPGRTHEIWKKTLARMLETWGMVRGVRLYGYGSETHKHELLKRGLEADESYSLEDREGPPDLALEVVVTSPLLDKLSVYAALGVSEVWVVQRGQLAVHTLGADGYEQVATSPLLPALDLDRMCAIAREHDQVDAVRIWYEELLAEIA